uniref:Uncharacterized protein n=1 Tax=Ditylenchus dipsaci TaxID=166011 RepID=A0A915E8H6_9BILA
MNLLVFLVSLFPILGIFIAPRKFSASKSSQNQIECELGERWPSFSAKPLNITERCEMCSDSKNYAFVENTRREFGLEHLTWLRLLPFEKLPMHVHRKKIKKIQKDELDNHQKWNFCLVGVGPSHEGYSRSVQS